MPIFVNAVIEVSKGATETDPAFSKYLGRSHHKAST